MFRRDGLATQKLFNSEVSQLVDVQLSLDQFTDARQGLDLDCVRFEFFDDAAALLEGGAWDRYEDCRYFLRLKAFNSIGETKDFYIADTQPVHDFVIIDEDRGLVGRTLIQ